MNTYETTHRAACPNGNLTDTYKVTIQSHDTIMVETIIQTLADAPTPTYQEALADHLRNKLGCRVMVEGWHYGIKVICDRQ